ncbi:hypothetical protein K470DRAFT_70339 [Piedraia hortae CBS 480.64]|uniref:Uncharacterized protein n=1 Tax=Piedraia hortae CBS 480.64 TaxID=1314780 RepID=A0A6A7BZ04_9PEZI|nr:hypothetical protein K470DRAFT_70339 [Piedraia hortae CBS 480.64]
MSTSKRFFISSAEFAQLTVSCLVSFAGSVCSLFATAATWAHVFIPVSAISFLAFPTALLTTFVTASSTRVSSRFNARFARLRTRPAIPSSSVGLPDSLRTVTKRLGVFKVLRKIPSTKLLIPSLALSRVAAGAPTAPRCEPALLLPFFRRTRVARDSCDISQILLDCIWMGFHVFAILVMHFLCSVGLHVSLSMTKRYYLRRLVLHFVTCLRLN